MRLTRALSAERVTETSFHPPETAVPPERESREDKKARETKDAQRLERWRINNHDHADLSFNTLGLREGGEARALNRLLIRLGEERPHALQQAMSLPALTAIKEKGKAEVAQMLDEAVFTEKATLDLMFDEQHAFSTRQINKARDRTTYIKLPDDELGRPRSGRVMLALPPQPNHKRNPDAVSKKYMEALGYVPNARDGRIPDSPLPFVFKDPRDVKRLGDELVKDQPYLMPAETEDGYEVEACGFNAKQIIGQVRVVALTLPHPCLRPLLPPAD